MALRQFKFIPFKVVSFSSLEYLYRDKTPVRSVSWQNAQYAQEYQVSLLIEHLLSLCLKDFQICIVSAISAISLLRR